MKNIIRSLIMILTLLIGAKIAVAQGPPILGDKPIMLGGDTHMTKTLVEVRSLEKGTITRIPLVYHYLPTSNTLIGVHIPLTHFSPADFFPVDGGWALGDITLLGKYQFFRADEMGKTFRMVAKTTQNIPIGRSYGIDGISTGELASYFGLVAGYETLRYGISGEVGYLFQGGSLPDLVMTKVGLGLPLLKPVYPVKQLNLYFETAYEIHVPRNAEHVHEPGLQYSLLYAQGIQYAIKKFTFDLAVQIPVSQNVGFGAARNYSLLIGTRYILN